MIIYIVCGILLIFLIIALWFVYQYKIELDYLRWENKQLIDQKANYEGE